MRSVVWAAIAYASCQRLAALGDPQSSMAIEDTLPCCRFGFDGPITASAVISLPLLHIEELQVFRNDICFALEYFCPQYEDHTARIRSSGHRFGIWRSRFRVASSTGSPSSSTHCLVPDSLRLSNS